MALPSGFSPTAPGGPPPLSELRIVLLGKVGAGKSKVARALLRGKEVKEGIEHCVLYESEQAGRRICVVNTPGWDELSIHCTSDTDKSEIVKSVTHCPPGPHALLLVLPVTNHAGVPDANELKTACRHVELLSEKVWKHTIVVFCCHGDVEKSVIKAHIANAHKLLEKCGGRQCVLQNLDSNMEVQGLDKEIKYMMKENRDTVFNLHTNPDAERKSMDNAVLRHRRGSLGGHRPSMDEETEDSQNQTKNTETTKSPSLNLYYNIPQQAAIIGTGATVALIGSVAGSIYGTVGSFSGIVVGFVIGILVALWLIRIT